MNTRTFQTAFLSLLSAVILVSCSTKGPDLVDPKSDERREVSLFGIDTATGGELLFHSEQKGTVFTSNYASANNGEQLGHPVDAIYENSGKLYLHHRDNGSITLLDLGTRAKRSTITGFPSGVEGELSGMAFTNMSQGWVICYGSPNLYEVDLVNERLSHTHLLPYFPTSVATLLETVFVGMETPDGTGQVGVVESNGRTIAIKKTIDFPSPIIYMFPSNDGSQCIMLSAGGNGAGPKVYYVDGTSLSVVDEYELPVGELTSYIGEQPNYAGITRDDYLYLALPSSVFRYDVQGFTETEFITGSYPVIGVDYYSGLLYAYDAGRKVVARTTFEGEGLSDVSVPADVRSIRFLSANQVTVP